MDIQKYITGGTLRAAVEKAVEEYESCTNIDEYMRHSGTTWFYEYTIQGFIYSQLVYQYDAGYNPSKKYLIFLEGAYTADNSDNRADILFTELPDAERKNCGAIEIKTDFQEASVLGDLQKLARYLNEEKIATGYAIFFAKTSQEITQWESNFRSDRALKPLFTQKKLFAVGMIGNPL